MAATVIDELVVTLGLDPKNFNKEQQNTVQQLRKMEQQATQSRKVFEEEGKRAAEGYFGKLKSEALGLFAVMVGTNSLKEFIGNTVNGISAIDRASKAAGMSIQDMTMFGNVIEANGGKADVARQSISQLAQVMEDWRTGIAPPSPQMWAALGRIGAGPQDDPITVYEKFAKWAEGKNPQLVSQEGRLLGFDEAATNEAMKGLTQVMKDFADAKARGLPTSEDAAKLRELQGAFRGLSQEVQAAARGLLVDFAPALTTTIGMIRGDDSHLTHEQQDAKKNAWWRFFAFMGPEPTSGVGEPLRFGRGAAGGMDLVKPISHDDLRASVLALAGGKPNPVAAASGSGTGQKLIAALVAAGFTPEQAAGIAAWSYAESGGFKASAFNPAGGGQGAYGIGQWRGARLRALRAQYGNNPTVDQQIAFMVSELMGSERGAAAAIRGTGSAQDALWATITKFGRGSASDNMGDWRRGIGYLGGGARLAAGVGGTIVTGNTTTVHIDRIDVNAPSATDARGIARKLAPALSGALATQANSGLAG